MYLKEKFPDAKTVGLTGWDVGEPSNTQIKDDILEDRSPTPATSSTASTSCSR